jgi:sugar phosphate permease
MGAPPAPGYPGNAMNETSPVRGGARFEAATYRKVSRRLIPFLVLCYIVAYLDRVNVGFAKLSMLADLGFSETVYGLGAGVFFVGYFFFEVPSNVVLHRSGARRWIARIMITWGLLAAAMLLVRTQASFYALRFLLGAAEAGFFPGMILYLTYWYPAARRGRITTLFMTAVGVSSVLGGPLSGAIVKGLAGACGLAGWQWMFLLEGLPSVLVGVAVLFFLDDGIPAARWLSPAEKAMLDANVSREEHQKGVKTIAGAFREPKVWRLALVYFCFDMGLYGISFWLPTLVKATGVGDPWRIGLLTAIPWSAAVAAMILVSWSADAHRERRWHVAIPGLVGAAGLGLAVVWNGDTVRAMAALTLATMGILTTLPLFWSLPTAILGGTAAPAGIGLVSSVGNLAGFLSPFLIGWFKDRTGSTDAGMAILVGFVILGSTLTLSFDAEIVNQ